MIDFIEKTWLLWWIFAVVVIVRWYYLLPDPAKMRPLKMSASREEIPYFELKARSEVVVHKERLISLKADSPEEENL